jgi:DNA-directed RNA polymerase beta subunit
VDLTEWNDYPKQRRQIFDAAQQALTKQFPVSFNGVRLELHDVAYADPEEYSLAEQKQALLQNKVLGRRLRGTYRLFDDKTNQLLDERPATLMKVPYLTERGSVLHNGTEYVVNHQARLRPGIYTRVKANGELESHVNTRRGTGTSMRVRLEPETGLFKLDIGQASLRLYSLLKDLGHSDEDLEQRWGPELLQANRDKYDARVFDKAYQRLVRRPNPVASREEKAQAIRDALEAAQVDREVVERTLPNLFNRKVAAAWQQPAEPVSRSLTKDDLEMLALFLDKQFRAGIPLDGSAEELVQAIMAEIEKQMPGVNPAAVGTLNDTQTVVPDGGAEAQPG